MSHRSENTSVVGAGALGAGSSEQELVTEGVMWSKSLKMLLKPVTLARGEGPEW